MWPVAMVDSSTSCVRLFVCLYIKKLFRVVVGVWFVFVCQPASTLCLQFNDCATAAMIEMALLVLFTLLFPRESRKIVGALDSVL